MSNRGDKSKYEQLPLEHKGAWTRILSAIQTSESMESHVLEPLLHLFSSQSLVFSFLKQQSIDEERHSSLIKKYLIRCLGFQKENPTISDRIFYSLLFPASKQFLLKRPIYALSVLLFYEYFSVGLYRQLLIKAKQNELWQLQSMIQGILKDESMHIKGISQLIRTLKHAQRFSTQKMYFLNVFLRAVSLDVSFGQYAIHNKDIRDKLRVLGIDPELINKHRLSAVTKVISLVCELEGTET